MSTTSSQVSQLDATAQAELVESGEVTATELAEGAISRSEAVNPEVNAIISPLYDEARESAAGELPAGPFRGVPFVFKDLGAGLTGHPYHMGNRVLKEIDFRMPVDTHLGLRFRDAGLVTIGRANTPELGILPTTEPEAHGASRNPWDTSRTTGGSSGGSGAAVASGIVPIAHASDGGGSIRIPASANGLVGLKASRARISHAPLFGDVMSGLTTELVVTKSVRDLATMLDWVHGPVAGEPYGCPEPAHPYVEDLKIAPGNLRIAVLTDSITGDEVEPAVVEAVRRTAEKLEALGHEITDLRLPETGEPEHLKSSFTIRWAAGMSATVDALAPFVGRELTEDDVEPLTWALAERGRSVSGAQYLAAVQEHQILARLMAALYRSEANPGGADLILTPTLAKVPTELGYFDQHGPDPWTAMDRAGQFANFTAAFNATGQPAISLPMEMSEEGLPIGIQLIAPIWREDILFRIAAQVEEAYPWVDRRPAVFADGS